jgi:hypothetical protein
MITVLHQLSIYTSMKQSLLQISEKALVLQSFDTLSDIKIKVLALLFLLRCSVYLKPKPTLLGVSFFCK